MYCSLLLYEDCEPRVNDQMLWLVIYYSMSHIVLIYDFYTNTYYKIMYNRIENVIILFYLFDSYKLDWVSHSCNVTAQALSMYSNRLVIFFSYRQNVIRTKPEK